MPGRRDTQVALFITCLVDTFFPEVGQATVRVLERLGCQVEFPRDQTCCGQMHANSGYPAEAGRLARRFGEVFAGFDTIVTPSGSCAATVRHQYGMLDEGAAAVGGRVMELSEFIVDRLGVVDVGARLESRVALHQTCHSLRALRVGERPRRLLKAVRGLQLVDLSNPEECCGFGGTFAVKNADVSEAMLTDKVDDVFACGADVVTAVDSSCLMNISGALSRSDSPVKAMHLAEILAAE